MLLNDTLKMVKMATFTFYVFSNNNDKTKGNSPVQETGDQTLGTKENSQEDDKEVCHGKSGSTGEKWGALEEDAPDDPSRGGLLS